MENIIRIHAGEYEGMPEDLHAHFNLAPAHHVVGARYVLPRIVRAGRDGENAIPPILDYGNAWICDCVGYTERLALSEVPDALFGASMLHIGDHMALASILLKRYRASRPHLSDEMILGHGVSVTMLRRVGMMPAGLGHATA